MLASIPRYETIQLIVQLRILRQIVHDSDNASLLSHQHYAQHRPYRFAVAFAQARTNLRLRIICSSRVADIPSSQIQNCEQPLSCWELEILDCLLTLPITDHELTQDCSTRTLADGMTFKIKPWQVFLLV